jgi:AcrR family transcriptional regulator
MGRTNPGNFAQVCKRITAIPGRSKEELLDSYFEWRAARLAAERQCEVLQRAAARASMGADPRSLQREVSQALEAATNADALRLPPLSDGLLGKNLRIERGSENATKADADPAVPWAVRVRSSYGLSARHHRSQVGHAASPILQSAGAEAARRLHALRRRKSSAGPAAVAP